MSDISPLPPAEPTYRAIEEALAGHERGRRFLAEHARRSRHDETAALLDAVARLHERAAAARPDAFEADLPALRDLTATAEASLAEATPSPQNDGDDILDMVESIQETAWRMREAGTDASLCDLLDGLAVRLNRACHGREQRDLALERARDAVGRLGLHLADLEMRPTARSDISDASVNEDDGITGPDDLTPPGGNDVVVSDGQPPAPARSKRKSRTRSAASDRG